MAVQWSSVDGHMRVGINVTFSSNAPVGTTVDVTIDYWIENTQSFSDGQTLNYDSGSGTNSVFNFTNSYGAVQTLIKSVTRSNLTVSYSGGPTYTADAEITGAYDGSNPFKSRAYTLPARQSQVPDAPGTTVVSVGSSSGRVYLTAPSNNGSTIDAYQIEIATNSGYTTGYQLANNSDNTFTGLAAATTYFTRARAHNANGWGPYTANKTFTTGATVPGAPTGVGNSAVTQSTATIAWTAPGSTGGSAITGYEVQIATDSGFTVNVQTITDPDDVSPYGLTGLNPATTYWARVRALNGVGAGAFSSSTTFTTLTGTPVMTSPGAAEASSKGWPYGIVSATGIQATSTITMEVGKQSSTATIGMTAAGATDLITRTDGAVHGLVADDTVTFLNVTNAAPLVVGTTYWVIASGLTTTAFKLATTLGGTAIDITGTGAGSMMVDKKAAFSSTALTTAAATNLLTRTDGAQHGLVETDVVYFTAVVNGAPLAVATPYYVIASGLTTTVFKVAATPGGTEIDLTQSGTGTTMIRYHTVTLTPGSASGDNTYTLQDTSKMMNNGTYQVRSRVFTSAISYTTPDSPTITYTVSHTPSTLLVSPATGSTAKYTATTNFTFNFSDSNLQDKMTAYQLVIEDNATGGVTYTLDSGKVALVGTGPSQQFVRTAAISSGQKGQTLRWKVRTWDENDQPSSYTGYSTLTLVDPPVVAITAPANASVVGTGTPIITWTVTNPSGGTQATAYVEVKDSTTNTVVWSNTITGTAVTTTPAAPILQNGKSYTVSVTSTDSFGLATTTSNSFTATYSAPPSIKYSVDETDADDLGYIDVSWVDATADSLFTQWKVYRKALSDSTNTWNLVFTSTDQNVRHYFDYLLVPGESYSYSVTQTAFRSGSVLESTVGYYLDALSNVTEETRYYFPDISHYWIVDPHTNSNSVRLENVTNDDSSLEFESETYNIVGRGRHRDYGDELGYSGTITCSVRQPNRASAFRKKMETLRRNQETYYLRTPFGRLFPVALGNIGWSPIAGTGVTEMGDMSIPYEEVS